jgi:hypothetical protein
MNIFLFGMLCGLSKEISALLHELLIIESANGIERKFLIL